MRITILFLCTILITPGALAQKDFTFCYDPYPPFTLGQTGKPTGGSKVELINTVFNEIDGINANVILLPWKQCQLQVKRGNIDGILPLFKNNTRSEYMIFSDSTFRQNSVFWYKKSKYPNGINWSTFEDLSHLKLGMLIGGYIDKDMENTFESGKGIQRGKSVDNLFKLLLKERVDLVAIDESVGYYVRNKNQWNTDIEKLDKEINIKYSYFGLSKKSDVIHILPAINKAIKKLKATGVIDAK